MIKQEDGAPQHVIAMLVAEIDVGDGLGIDPDPVELHHDRGPGIQQDAGGAVLDEHGGVVAGPLGRDGSNSKEDEFSHSGFQK
jgi:hypothetical protein